MQTRKGWQCKRRNRGPRLCRTPTLRVQLCECQTEKTKIDPFGTVTWLTTPSPFLVSDGKCSMSRGSTLEGQGLQSRCRSDSHKGIPQELKSLVCESQAFICVRVCARASFEKQFIEDGVWKCGCENKCLGCWAFNVTANASQGIYSSVG